MKQLTDKELALYLGCEAEIHGKGLKWSYVGTLTAWVLYQSTIDLIKPILRPLSHITEEELIGLNQIIQPELEIKPGDLTEAIDQLRNKGIKIIDFSDIPAPVVFETTAYLLSCGFDLFNWIEQGLAISKHAIGIATDTPQRSEE